MEIGEIIKKIRLEKGLTMKELGSKVGVTEQAISQYERNKRTPSDALLIKIFEALEFDINSYIKTKVVPLPIWNYTLEYIKELFEYISSDNPKLLENLKYLTALEVNEFIDKSSLFIMELAKKHKLENTPDSPTVAIIEEVDELNIELNDLEQNDFNITDKKESNITPLPKKEKQIWEEPGKEYLMPIASHDKDGNFTEEEYKHDDDLMNDEDLWK
ncbi:phage transcriptional regulator [Clostridium perfringens]|uniref:helix-turn-helix domain-containing protein n=1 Tax=Clostridium perfringens TaxID=1502 RepID=UPI000D8D4124|nr:helix-turn-helix transcriptional regulator [Clostridium perfringens]SQB23278.1 phage transcriptional regulator [Clostridium perfringens]